jgi:D,D-heptose 1,7-bisphosphate phosphatase
MKKAVFLDKDGTLIEDVPYNVDTTLIKLYQHSVEGLSLLQKYGYMLVLVSNQPGVAKGFFTETDLEKVFDKISLMLKSYNVKLDAFYYCPHFPLGEPGSYIVDCDCRKPAPGLLFRAAQEHNINLSNSWMIGDILNDIEAGNRAGCKTLLVDNNNETEWRIASVRKPTGMVKNLEDAAKFILVADNKLV